MMSNVVGLLICRASVSQKNWVLVIFIVRSVYSPLDMFHPNSPTRPQGQLLRLVSSMALESLIHEGLINTALCSW